MTIPDIISICLAIVGSFFLLTGSIGLLRMPNFYTRVHASSLIDSMGAILILMAMAVYIGWNSASMKIILIVILILITSPAVIHGICQAVRHHKRQ